MRTIALLAVFLTCLLPANAQESSVTHPPYQEVSLSYVPTDDDIPYVRTAYVSLRHQPPTELGHPPPCASREAYFGRVMLGNPYEAYVCVLDESGGTGAGYDVLYFDADQNGYVLDNPRYDGELSGKTTVFKNVTASIKSGDESWVAYFTFSSNTERGFTNFKARGYFVGEMALGGERYRVAVFDDNANGYFGDKYSVHEESGRIQRGDALVIDLDRNGVFDKHKECTREVFPLSKYMVFNGACCEVDAAPDGKRLCVRPSDTPTGRLHFVDVSRPFSAELIGDYGPLKILGQPSDDGRGCEVQIPENGYSLAGCTFEGRLEDGTSWRITSRGKSDMPIGVKPGRTTRIRLGGMIGFGGTVLFSREDTFGVWEVMGRGLEDRSAATELVANEQPDGFGEPLLATIRMLNREKNTVPLTIEIKGRAGERYAPGSMTCDGEAIPPPSIVVRDEQGKQVAGGPCRYG